MWLLIKHRDADADPAFDIPPAGLVRT